MEYIEDNPIENKNLWQNDTVSVYADYHPLGDYYEVELAIGYMDENGYYFRLANTCTEEEAVEMIVNVLEIFG